MVFSITVPTYPSHPSVLGMVEPNENYENAKTFHYPSEQHDYGSLGPVMQTYYPTHRFGGGGWRPQTQGYQGEHAGLGWKKEHGGTYGNRYPSHSGWKNGNSGGVLSHIFG